MTSKDKPTEVSAVELDESALDTVQGGFVGGTRADIRFKYEIPTLKGVRRTDVTREVALDLGKETVPDLKI